MSYQVLTNITIQWVTPYIDRSGKTIVRDKRLTCLSLIHYEGSGSWADLTSKMKITLPKKIKLTATDENNNTYPLNSINGKTSSIGGYVGIGALPTQDPIPTFMRGDIITLDIGWRAVMTGKGGNETTYMTGGTDPTGNIKGNIPNLFKGFVSKVSPRQPFEIEIEDAMWLLKQVPTPTKDWGKDKTLQQIATECIASAYSITDNGSDGSTPLLSQYKKYGVELTVSKFSMTDLVFNVQNFLTRGESLAATLGRIKHQYKLDSWFRGYELRIGLTHYLPDDAVTHIFEFQKNILDDDKCTVRRKDDAILSMVVRSHYVEETGRTTKDGQKVIKNASTEILIYNKAGQFTYLTKKKGVEFPPNDAGQRFSYEIHDKITDEKTLFNMGVRQLKKYYYDGLSGSFETFGIPYVKHGDVVSLTNPLLPEMNGQYMVKAVNQYGGVDGLWQEIHLDYKITSLSDILSFTD